MPLIRRRVDQPGFLEDAEHLLHVHLPVRFLLGERQLERGAFHMVDEDMQVIGVDERVLGRRVEEIGRIPHDELIERRAARDEDRR